MGRIEELRRIIRQIILEAQKKKKVIGEPDMSGEKERNSPEEVDEMSLAGSISGPMPSLHGTQGTTGVPDSRAKRKRKNEKSN